MQARLRKKHDMKYKKARLEKLGMETMTAMLDFPDYHFVIDHPHLCNDSKSDWLETVLAIFDMKNVKDILNCCWFMDADKKACIKVLACARDMPENGCATTFRFNNYFMIYRIRPDKTCKLERIFNEVEFQEYARDLKSRGAGIITFQV